MELLTQMSSDAPKKGTRPKGAKPRLSGVERRAQILASATSLFRTKGLSAVRMDDIAVACGITKPVLYSHFRSKEALFEACLSEVSGELTQKLISALGEPKSNRQSLYALMKFVQDHGLLLSDSESAGQNNTAIGTLLSSHRENLILTVAHILAAERPEDMDELTAIRIVEPLAHALLGAAEGGAKWWQTRPSVTPEETQRLSQLVLNQFLELVANEFRSHS